MPDISESNWSERDDHNAEVAPLGWPPGLPAQIELIGRMVSGAIKRFWNRANPVYLTTGSADNFIVTTESQPTTLRLYEIIRIRANRANTTTTPTLKYARTNARNIVKIGATGTVALVIGDIQAGRDHSFYYDGTNFVLSNPATVDSSVTVGLLKSANNLSDVADAPTSRANLGLGNVNNTSDANKPVSTPQATAIAASLATAEAYTDAGVATRLPLAGGTMSGGVNFANQTISNPAGNWLQGYLSPNFTIANNVGDPVNSIDFAAGICGSTEPTPIVMNHAAATSILNVVWGTGNGGLFDAAISNGTWHCFIISNGTLVSRGFSKLLNPTTAPNYPAAYTHYRRIGSILREAATIIPFSQNGDEFIRSVPGADLNNVLVATTAVLATLSVPTGLLVNALMRCSIINGATTAASVVLVSSPSESDRVPNAIGGDYDAQQQVVSVPIAFNKNVRTNTSGQIRYRGGNATTGLSIATYGWVDTRGRL